MFPNEHECNFHYIYRFAVEKMDYCFTHHEIIYNPSGEPVDYTFLYVNEAFERTIGVKKEKIISKKVTELLPDVMLNNPEWVRACFEVAMSCGEKKVDVYFKLVKRWFSAHVISNQKGFFSVISRDITLRKKAEEDSQLNISRLEALVRLSHMDDASLEKIVDFAYEEGIRLTKSRIGYVAFLNQDESKLKMFSWSSVALRECRINNRQIEYDLQETGLWGETVRQRKPVITNDYNAQNPYKKGYPQGHVEIRRHMNIPVFDGDRIVAVAGVGNKKEPYDDTDVMQLTLLMDTMWKCFKRKQAEDEIIYLSFHDKLTGLYNRAFFEKELKRIDKMEYYPLSIILGDINGLKLTNDIFGHMEGDRLLKRIAGILKSSCRSNDIIARWGGDEFAVILPKTTRNEAHDVCNKIRKACSLAEGNVIQPSIALGSTTKSDPSCDLRQVLKEAEDRMYRHKLLEGRSARNAIISSLEKTLFEKSFETEEHAKRLMQLSYNLGKVMGLSESELDELHLLSILHDIGKIAISDAILAKPGRLTPDEWKEMRKHSEIGFRIAESSQELSHIAEHILCHHERWDGKGYPQGLKCAEIPRLSRILAVVDAYDVMTNERPYKKAVGIIEALDELERCSGSQFDPEVVCYFVGVIRK